MATRGRTDDGRTGAAAAPRGPIDRGPAHGRRPHAAKHVRETSSDWVEQHAAAEAEAGAYANRSAEPLSLGVRTAAARPASAPTGTSAAVLAAAAPIAPAERAGAILDDGLDEADAGHGAQGSPHGREHRGGAGVFLRDLLVVAVLALVLSVGIKTFLVRPFYIPSASMHDTLIENDRVLVSLLSPDTIPLTRGSVVVFRDPGGWLPPTATVAKTPVQAVVDGVLETIGLKPEETSDHLIKRVLGLPGDHVVCCNAYGQIVVNDVPVSEPYVQLAGHAAASGISFDVTVPAGHVWVMGDNRYNSEDSRYHQDGPGGGFVPMEDITGRAFLINWPLDRFTWLSDYPEVFSAVPSREPEGAAQG